MRIITFPLSAREQVRSNSTGEIVISHLLACNNLTKQESNSTTAEWPVEASQMTNYNRIVH